MRLKITMQNPEKSEIYELPLDYRRIFISFFKSCFKNTPIYNELYGEQKVWKPFAFSVKFSKIIEIKSQQKTIVVKSPFEILFTSGDYNVIAHLVNGVLKLQTQSYKWKDIVLPQVSNIQVLKTPEINSKEIMFQTVGISILTNPFESAKNFENYFLIPPEDKQDKEKLEKFNQILNYRTCQKFEYFKNKKCPSELLFEPISIKSDRVFFYGGYLRGFRGTFKLKGDLEILKFIYDYGFGVKTGQGFGVLKIVYND